MVQKKSALHFLLFAVALAAVWLPIIHLLGAQWSIYDQYRYGWAVPCLCLYLAWQRWKSLGSRGDSPIPLGTSTVGVPVSQLSTFNAFRGSTGDAPVALGVPLSAPFVAPISAFQLFAFSAFCLLLLPTRILQEANPLWRFASYALACEAIVITLALICLAGGFRALRQFAFPVCFFLVAVPWPTPVEGAIIQSLTRLNTATVLEIVNVLGVPALVHGNVIEVSTGLVGVDEACSGIRSTQAVFMLALFFGEYYREGVRARLMLLAGGLFAALLLNIVRTSILIGLAAHGGTALSEKWHDTTGITVLLGCFVLVWGMALVLSRRRTRPSRVSSDDSPSYRFSILRPLPFGRSLAYVCVISFSLLSVIGSELWFRWHEQKHRASEEQIILLPRAQDGFRENQPSAEVKSKLQYDSATCASWRNADGTFWQFFHFRWNPATALKDRVRIQLAKSHRPEICLPAAGRTLEREFAPFVIAIGGVEFPFRSYEFKEARGPLFVFFCVLEDGTPSGSSANMRESHRSRWRAARQGNRGLGQRSVEIAITGARDLAQAQVSLRDELPRLIHIQPH